MSATQFDPSTISVTEAAQAHIAAQIARSGRRFLKLGVKESGCNGFMYTLDYIDSPLGEDERFAFGDIDVYVQREELELVRGTEIDFEVEGLNSALKFKNPRAESYCGCGESFSIKED
ncbi:MAG: iron-sulfur cluster assembly accessory protein [Pseudomonadota bacterium]